MISSSPGTQGATNTPTGHFARREDTPLAPGCTRVVIVPNGDGPNWSLSIARLDVKVEVEETRLDGFMNGFFAATLAVRFRGRVTAGIRQVFVDEGWRGKGIGTLMMRQAAIIAEAAGCRSVALTVAPDKRDLIPFYEACGYFPAFEYDDGEVALALILNGGRD
jgi:GNAT superfamily N-acetyltransferase